MNSFAPQPKSRRKWTTTGPDCARYHVLTGKLFVPTPRRPILTYWFHFGRYGGHHGINRTVRRLSRHVWWPRMPREVPETIKNCLVCSRHRRNQRRSLYGILSKPFLSQLISSLALSNSNFLPTKEAISPAVQTSTGPSFLARDARYPVYARSPVRGGSLVQTG